MRRFLVVIALAVACAAPVEVAAPAALASTAKFDGVTVSGAAGEKPVVTVEAP